MKTAEDLLNAEARSQADIDEFHEARMDAAIQRIDEIVNDPGQRDVELFELFGAPVDDTPDDYIAIPVFERDAWWANSLSALMVAARMQTWIEMYGLDALEMFERNGEEINSLAREMDNSLVKEAAIKGIGKARINGEKERRKEDK